MSGMPFASLVRIILVAALLAAFSTARLDRMVLVEALTSYSSSSCCSGSWLACEDKDCCFNFSRVLIPGFFRAVSLGFCNEDVLMSATFSCSTPVEAGWSWCGGCLMFAWKQLYSQD